MKKLAFYMLMLVMSIGYAYAQGGADIKFDKTTHNFGTFSENNPVVSCTFTFTNVGDAPLESIRQWHLADVQCPNIRRSL